MKKVSPLNASIGLRIKEIRTKKKWTQDKLAEKAGICDGQQISNIERGLCGLSIAKFIDICKVLEVEADYLLFGISAGNCETQAGKYLEQMTDEQAKYAIELIKVYAKSCGIE